MLLLLACQAPSSGGDGAAPAALVINEVVAQNRSTWDDGFSAYPDWIEVYNASDTPVPRAAITLSDGESTWRGTQGDLAPGEHLFVVADGTGGARAPFRLGAGDTIRLAVDGVQVDEVEILDPVPDVATARHPDGGAWADTVWATPAEPNPAAPSPTLDPSDDVFGIQKHDIHIELSDEAMASLRLDRLTWVEGAVTIDGMRYAPVEVRLKSTHGSRREVDQKPGWKIDLDGMADFSWKGLTRLTLNSMVQDQTYLREHLAYTFFADAGVPSPRLAWVSLRVNDMDYGVSLLVETPGESLLARWYEDPTGALYEGQHGSDLEPGRVGMFDYDSGPEPADHTALTALIDALARPPDEASLAMVEEHLDLDQVLTQLANESVSLFWDGYSNNRNNYRLYHDPLTGRFDLLPWGADETFDRIVNDPWGGNAKLVRFCLAVPSCRARYDEKLLEAADRLDALDLPARAVEVEAWLRPYIEADPKREFDMARHDMEVQNTLHHLRSWPEQVRGMVVSPRSE
ncbi:MAG: CotH kinase family protein [Myxococcota bacterium]